MKKIYKILILCVFTLCLAACSNHTHTYSKNWSYNETKHWHSTTCDHNSEIDQQLHSFNNIVTEPTYEHGGYTTHTCSVCGYSYIDNEKDSLAHRYSETWSYNDTSHWHMCIDQGYNDLKMDETEHSFNVEVVEANYEHNGYITRKCTVCGFTDVTINSDTLNHHYSKEWSYDENQHWHNCIDSGYEDLKSDVEGHIFNDVIVAPTYEHGGYTTHTCTMCNYSYVDSYTDQLVHDWSNDWSYNDINHWHDCLDDGYETLRSDEQSHIFNNVITNPTYEHGGYTTHTCSVCGYSYVDNETDRLKYTVTWENWDGSILKTEELYLGEIPYFDDENPNRPSNREYSYEFVGWSPEISPVSENSVYTAQYSTNKIGAKLNIVYSFYKTDSEFIETLYEKPIDLGSVSVSNAYPFNTTINLYSNSYNYYFIGWYYNGLCLSTSSNYSYTISNEDVTLEARYRYTSHSLRVFANKAEKGSVMILENNKGYKSEDSIYLLYTDSVTLVAETKTETRFLGWYDENNNLLSTNPVYTLNMPNKSLNIEARWNYFTIDYILNGGVYEGSLQRYYTVDNGISLPYVYKIDYTFVGWKLDGEIMTSFDYSRPRDIVLEAVWKQTEENLRNIWLAKSYAARPISSDNFETVQYGLYPQSRVKDEKIESSLNSLDISDTVKITTDDYWYVYNNEYYKKYNDCWYKCEPITWIRLTGSGDGYIYICSVLLDTIKFYSSGGNSDKYNNRTIDGQVVYPSEYKYSSVRAWLNGYNGLQYDVSNYRKKGFIDIAFKIRNDALLEKSNDKDKIFLLSMTELSRLSISLRQCQYTDYARARGATRGIGEFVNNGTYWTSTAEEATYVTSVSPNGNFHDTTSYLNSSTCIRPCILLDSAYFLEN